MESFHGWHVAFELLSNPERFSAEIYSLVYPLMEAAGVM